MSEVTHRVIRVTNMKRKVKVQRLPKGAIIPLGRAYVQTFKEVPDDTRIRSSRSKKKS